MLLVIVSTATIFFIMSNQAGARQDVVNPDINQIVKNLTVETGEVTTNLKDDHFIKVNFNIQVSNKEAKDELTKRLFQVKNAVIYILSGMTPNDLEDQKGIANLEKLIQSRVNDFLQNGHVTHVYTTEKIVQ
jgi:flagellar FliL protein